MNSVLGVNDAERVFNYARRLVASEVEQQKNNQAAAALEPLIV